MNRPLSSITGRIQYNPDILRLWERVEDKGYVHIIWASPFDVPSSIWITYDYDKKELILEFYYISDHDFLNRTIGDFTYTYGQSTHRLYKISISNLTADNIIDKLGEAMDIWKSKGSMFINLNQVEWNLKVIVRLIDISRVALRDFIFYKSGNSSLIIELNDSHLTVSQGVTASALRAQSIWYRIPILGKWLIRRKLLQNAISSNPVVSPSN